MSWDDLVRGRRERVWYEVKDGKRGEKDVARDQGDQFRHLVSKRPQSRKPE